jgi:hypothetical protein
MGEQKKAKERQRNSGINTLSARSSMIIFVTETPQMQGFYSSDCQTSALRKIKKKKDSQTLVPRNQTDGEVYG